MRLLDFEVVFEYLLGRPDIHLCVKRFKVDNGQVRRNELRHIRMLKKDKHIYRLMLTLFRKLHERPLFNDTADISDSNRSGSINSQNDNPHSGVSQQMFLSQIPPIRHHTNTEISADGDRVLLTRGAELLGRLRSRGSSSKPDGTPQKIDRPGRMPDESLARTTERQSSVGEYLASDCVNTVETLGEEPRNGSITSHQCADSTFVKGPDMARSTGTDARNCRSPMVNSEEQRPARPTQQPNPGNGIDPMDEEADRISDSRQRKTNGSEIQDAPTTTLKKPSRNDPGSTERLQLNRSTTAQTREKHVARILDKHPIDLWEGMTRIHSRDVKIPEDQKKLLDHSPCWIPSSAGTDMPQGHVPPLLLKQWNAIALRRNRLNLGERDNLVTGALETLERSPHDLAISSGSDQEDEVLSWSTSERDESPLPRDSSPIAAIGEIGIEQEADQHREQADSQNDRSSKERNETIARNVEALDASHHWNHEVGSQLPISEPVSSAHVDGENTNGKSVTDPGQAAEGPALDREDIVSEPLADAATGATGKNHADSRVVLAEDRERHQSMEQNIHTEPLGGAIIKAQETCISVASPERNQKFGEERALAKLVPIANTQLADNESDTDSAMEVSIPRPLGASSQLISEASQAQEPTSSCPALPELRTGEQVQVLVTPATDIKRLRSGMLGENNINLGECAVQNPSPRGEKSSSQSRVFNTYRSHESRESHNQGGPSQETTDSAEQSERMFYGIDVIGTQMSNEDIMAPASISDSVRTNVDEQVSRIEKSPVIRRNEDDGILYSSRFAPSQRRESGDHGSAELSSIENARDKSPMVNLKRPRGTSSEIEALGEQATKRYQISRDESDGKFTDEFKTPVSRVVSRRESYMGSSFRHEKVKRLYKKFRSDYPSYLGGLNHFLELCARLEALRKKGELQRSFMWDDFVVMHLEEYPSYVEQCRSTNKDPLQYEDFFTSKYFRPVHRKRSLTVAAVEICAAHSRSASRSSASRSPSTSRRSNHPSDVNVSITASFIDRLKNLRALSSARNTQSASPGIGTESGRRSAEIWPPSPREAERRTQSGAPEMVGVIGESLVRKVDTTPPPSHPTLEAAHPSTHQEPTSESSVDEDEDMRDEIHETASIELGDTPSTSSKTGAEGYVSAAEFGSESSPEQQPAEGSNDNWFASMAHVHPIGPVWSDSPTTEFKNWARADQNVLIERKCRRGFPVPVDEKGVIVPTYFT